MIMVYVRVKIDASNYDEAIKMDATNPLAPLHEQYTAVRDPEIPVGGGTTVGIEKLRRDIDRSRVYAADSKGEFTDQQQQMKKDLEGSLDKDAVIEKYLTNNPERAKKNRGTQPRYW